MGSGAMMRRCPEEAATRSRRRHEPPRQRAPPPPLRLTAARPARPSRRAAIRRPRSRRPARSQPSVVRVRAAPIRRPEVRRPRSRRAGASVAAARGSGSRGADSTGGGSTGVVSSDGDSAMARAPERADIARDLAFLALTARRGAARVAGSAADGLDASGSLGPAPPFSSGLLGVAMATCFLAARSCFSTY